MNIATSVIQTRLNEINEQINTKNLTFWTFSSGIDPIYIITSPIFSSSVWPVIKINLRRSSQIVFEQGNGDQFVGVGIIRNRQLHVQS